MMLFEDAMSELMADSDGVLEDVADTVVGNLSEGSARELLRRLVVDMIHGSGGGEVPQELFEVARVAALVDNNFELSPRVSVHGAAAAVVVWNLHNMLCGPGVDTIEPSMLRLAGGVSGVSPRWY